MINRVEPFKPEHLKMLDLQPQQQDELDIEDGAPKEALLFSLFEAGDVLAVIGFVEETPTRRMATALISRRAGKAMLSIVRAMKRMIALYAVQRVEMVVKTDFKPAHRLARLLGFTREGTMRKFAAGQDYDIYALIREDN